MPLTHLSDDLHQLLDSALDDFQTLHLAQRNKDVKKAEGCCLTSENKIIPGLGMGLPDLRTSKKKGRQKSAASETLNKLREQTRETVKGLESIKKVDFGCGDVDAMLEDWVQQFEELTASHSHSQELDSMMETMMHQVLSKQLLHEPIKEIQQKYPKWLQENQSKLCKQEYERYVHQHELIRDLNAIYETQPGNFNKIAELMQKMQECGQPPNDIVKELAPDFDISAFAKVPSDFLGYQENCCII